jgi:Rha family phage regulatory protein
MEELVFKSEKGTPVTTSLLVAKKFGKQHKDVLDAIRTLAENSADLPEIKTMFHETLAPDSYGRMQPVFIMNRDGFSLLVMGFTGKDALKFKLEFIEAFNKMENIIASYKDETPEMIMARALKVADATIERHKLQLEQANHTILEQAPKVEYYDQCLESKGYLTVNMIAAELGISSIKLNKLLCEWGIQYKQSDCFFCTAIIGTRAIRCIARTRT